MIDRRINDKGDYYKATARLLTNALRFRYNKLKRHPLKPTAISLALTNRCNSHCIMCNIWKSTRDIPDIKSQELSGQQIIDLLSRPLFSELVELDLTGGEPHLRDDLVEIALGIIQLKKNYLPRLKSLIITSNGFLTRQIILNYGEILEAMRDTGVDLVSVTSLDGIREVHDTIRGTKGAYIMTSETLRELSELRKGYPNLIPGIKSTVLPQNMDALDDILDFALENKYFHIISPVEFTQARFRNYDGRKELVLKLNDYNRLLNFYNRKELETNYLYSCLRNFLATGRKQWSCTANFNYSFIDYDGTVYPCELLSEPIGNVKKQSFEDIWKNRLARGWRKKIGKMNCCLTCNEPGSIRYSAIIEGYSYLRHLSKMGKYKYNESLSGEGFIKYFNQ